MRSNKKANKIPDIGIEKSRVLNKLTPFVVKETYKALRTNIMFALPENNEDTGEIIIFTSAIPGEGKTTVCINTAITFAQTGAKVLLIDSDLRRPKHHKYFEISSDVGFSDVLGGFSKIEDVTVHIKAHNLDCVPCGHIPPNPTELLASKKTSDLLEELKKKYDYIFIDTPPINVVTDALALAPIVSGVALVIREKYTTHAAFRRILQSLQFANAKILGIVDNCADIQRENNRTYKKSSYGSYRKYGYYTEEYK